MRLGAACFFAFLAGLAFLIAFFFVAFVFFADRLIVFFAAMIWTPTEGSPSHERITYRREMQALRVLTARRWLGLRARRFRPSPLRSGPNRRFPVSRGP